ncbi:MAG: T9SS type A sorting domain-containing protein, partial [Bacteroidota bacterium]
AYYSRTGLGAKVNSVPMPMKYDNPELYYTLPLVFGNTDSSISSFGINIPNIGYYGQTVNRYNCADGWGTVITPYGSFSALRVKSDVYISDTIFYDSYGYGIKIPRFQNEYKWLSPQMGLPVLSVTKSTLQTTVIYQDSLIDNSGINFNASDDFTVSVYPNPSSKHVTIDFSIDFPADIKISFTDQLGRNFFPQLSYNKVNSRKLIILFPEHVLSPGIYYLNISDDNISFIEKIVVN